LVKCSSPVEDTNIRQLVLIYFGRLFEHNTTNVQRKLISIIKFYSIGNSKTVTHETYAMMNRLRKVYYLLLCDALRAGKKVTIVSEQSITSGFRCNSFLRNDFKFLPPCMTSHSRVKVVVTSNFTTSKKLD
jgi:hypothetical protein